MKYLARLMTALAVIISVAVALVTAIVKVTATGVFVLFLFVPLAWTALTAIVAPIKGGVLFFYASVLAFVALFGIALTRITKATTRQATFFGATAGYRTFDAMTLTTRTYQGHRHQLRTTTINGYRPADGAKGITRRWLSRKIPTGRVPGFA